MDFKLTREQELLKKKVGEFARGELAPKVKEIDEAEAGFSLETFHKMGALRLLRLPVPRENVKLLQTVEGTNQIQRLIIARDMLTEKGSFRETY